jgi:hypothetical protein
MVRIVVLATIATAIANAESREALAQLARQQAGRTAGHRDAGWAQHTFLVGVRRGFRRCVVAGRGGCAKPVTCIGRESSQV